MASEGNARKKTEARSKNKEVSMKVMLKVRGERQMCDLKLHTLWSSIKTDGYIGIVGQLDIVK